jgi:hypothetical protein
VTSNKRTGTDRWSARRPQFVRGALHVFGFRWHDKFFADREQSYPLCRVLPSRDDHTLLIIVTPSNGVDVVREKPALTFVPQHAIYECL